MAVGALMSEETAQSARLQAIEAARQALAQGRSPLIFTAHGKADGMVQGAFGEQADGLRDSDIGRFLGSVLSTLVETFRITRMAVAGGDTSGQVAQSLGLEALAVAAPICPGAPLCTGYRADGSTLENRPQGRPNGLGRFLSESQIRVTLAKASGRALMQYNTMAGRKQKGRTFDSRLGPKPEDATSRMLFGSASSATLAIVGSEIANGSRLVSRICLTMG